MFNKVELQEGVTLYIRQSDQFKTINFSVKWKTCLDENKAGHRAVLANVLQDSNSRYKTQSELRKALDELYGTIIYTDAAKRGDTHMVSLYAECVNDEFVNGTGVLDQVLELLRTVIFEPNFVNGQFDKSIVAREKRSVKERIRSLYDDKTRFAQKRMLELLRPNHPASASSNGTEQSVDALTSEQLLEAYNKMIQEDEIDIYIVGDIDIHSITEKIKKLFTFQARPARQRMTTEQMTGNDAGKVKQIREKQDMKQGKLHIGFGTPITLQHPNFAKMQVTNGVFGGFAHSKLFMNVREKESMAYYVSSSFASHYGLVYVMAGIDANLEEKAVQLIQEQLDALRNGDVTDLELEQTKALLANGIKSAFDSPRGQIEVFDQFKELDEHFSAEKLIAGWEAVTKEDIQKMASNIKLEIIYLLSAKEALHDE